MSTPPASEDLKLRLDKWLWAARFFKTRSAATAAISGGKVHVNKARAKPAREVRIGDVLEIRRGVDELVVVVQGLSNQRGPANLAATLYQETLESKAQREALAEQRKLLKLAAPQYERRPTKKERRQIVRFTRRGDPEAD
ncbi:MAG: S4 domain-containing protein [Gammaproteobacteria bacterium]